MILEKIYNHAPIWLQNVMCSVAGWRLRRRRYGVAFQKALAEYESHNTWSFDQMCDYRDAHLRKLVRHAYDTVPYYHNLFNDGGVNPDRIRTVDDLQCLPILTKQKIQKDPSRFLSSAFKGGGSSTSLRAVRRVRALY